MKHADIQKDVVAKYNITLDEHSKCWCRTHAHVKERRVCKWHPKNSMYSTFTLLLEIGHIETTTSSMRRCESEYYATQWALETAKKYKLNIPDKIVDSYQRYINMELDRGKRRGGKNYPGELKLHTA